jgi:hypothetical protein
MIWTALLTSRFIWGAIAALLLGVPAAGWTGYRVGHAYGWDEGVDYERARWQAERSRLLAEAAAQAEVLRAEGRAIAAELERARTDVRVQFVETVRVVRERASSTRACFNADVTAALNRSPIRETVERPGEPPRTLEEPAAGGTSELAAAEWVAGAQAAHEACRAQIGALAAWVRAAIAGSAR